MISRHSPKGIMIFEQDITEQRIDKFLCIHATDEGTELVRVRVNHIDLPILDEDIEIIEVADDDVFGWSRLDT